MGDVTLKCVLGDNIPDLAVLFKDYRECGMLVIQPQKVCSMYFLSPA